MLKSGEIALAFLGLTWAAIGCGSNPSAQASGAEGGGGGVTARGDNLGGASLARNTVGGDAGAAGDRALVGQGGAGRVGEGEAGQEADGESPELLPADCGVPEPGPLLGWAAVASETVDTTTGGGDAAPIAVRTVADFNINAVGPTSRVLCVDGNLEGTVSVGSNKTIIGMPGARITGSLRLSGSVNVIVRNLQVVGYNCSDAAICKEGADAVGINGGAHHIWIDHADISDGSDGNLDITQGADFITVSWTKFSYSTRRTDPDAGDSGHRFSNLIGASDTDVRDPGHLNVTYHHCWWADNVDQRMPRTRRGKIHVFNNLFTSTGNLYCTDAGFEARLLVENNVYIAVNRPLEVRTGGDMLSVGNVFEDVTDNTTVTGTGFEPPYEYSLDGTAELEEAIRSGVGDRNPSREL